MAVQYHLDIDIDTLKVQSSSQKKALIYMHVNAKMIPVETVSGIRGGSIKESGQI
jgi:hypothetical protein